MVDIQELFDSLSQQGVHFFSGVPDSLLNDFCLFLTQHVSAYHHVMAANEGNAVAIAAGNYLATGDIPIVYMQNSGIGNATNPLLSLTHNCVYGIPMVLVIGWRGDPAENDHAQHKRQGELTPILMHDMDIPFKVLDKEETVIDHFTWAIKTARESSTPVALIAKKGILSQKEKKQFYTESSLMSREEAIGVVLDTIGCDAVYLSTTGRATRELHEQLALKGFPQGREFANVGSMGHLSSIGLGVALACPQQRVVVFDGDAAVVMHMGSLATNCRYMAPNLLHIVLNNGVNESVGGQPSAGYVVDLTGIASACGYKTCGRAVKDAHELQLVLQGLYSETHPIFIDVHVRQGIRSNMPKLSIDHKVQKEFLMSHLHSSLS
ncbi:MAG: phosphonopyruvate decarboxylase [Bacteroidales bacterium]|nr:phosphonopyruvate decarboxylase [Bacteroidales bacterium]